MSKDNNTKSLSNLIDKNFDKLNADHIVTTWETVNYEISTLRMLVPVTAPTYPSAKCVKILLEKP